MIQLKPLLPYFRPYRRNLALGLLCILATSVLSLIAPLIIGAAIDRLSEMVDVTALLRYAGLLVLVTLIKTIFHFFQRVLLINVSRHIEFDLRQRFYSHLQKLHAGFFTEHPTGDLMARATNDLEAVRQLSGPAIMYGTNTLFTAVGALIFMIDIHFGLTLLALAVLPLVALITQFLGKRIHFHFQRVQEQFATLTSKVQENLSGARVIRAYVQEDAERQAYDRLNRDYVERNRILILWNSAMRPAIQGLMGAAFAGILAYGGLLMLEKTITVGDFVAFNIFLGKMAWPMIAIGWVVNLAQRGSVSLTRIQDIFNTEPAIRDREPLDLDSTVQGRLDFDQLSFTYPKHAEPALHEIDLSIEAGSTVAFVGRTGCGKTTLMSQVPRILEPPMGSLRIDGRDIHRIPLDTLRSAMAMVPQETFLFSVTLGENISFGRPDASIEEIERAAMLAGLDADMSAFPRGFDTLVGERGVTLSGGQKQRVALARAILRDPQVLLLDDCLSAVDAQTEERILSNLRTVFPGRTVLMATHRVAAARLCDQIVVLDRGRVMDRGTHDQLVARPGFYSDLNRRQHLEEQLAAAV